MLTETRKHEKLKICGTGSHSPVVGAGEGLDDDGQLVLDDVQVAGHGWSRTHKSVIQKESQVAHRLLQRRSPPMFCMVMEQEAASFPGIPKALYPSCS